MKILYNGQNKGQSFLMNGKTIHLLKGHPVYVSPAYTKEIEKKQYADIIKVELNDNCSNYERDTETKPPKYLFYPPSEELHKIYFTCLLRYFIANHNTSIVDICVPDEYKRLYSIEGINTISQEQATKTKDYTEVYRFDQVRYNKVSLAVSHPIDLMFAEMQLDRAEAIENGFFIPIIKNTFKKDKYNKSLKIGVALNGATKETTWDTDPQKEAVNKILDSINYKYDVTYDSFPQIHLFKNIDEISECDIVLSFGNSLLSYYALSLCIDTITILGNIKPKLSIGVFPKMDAFFDCDKTEKMQDIPFDLVESGIKTYMNKKYGKADKKRDKKVRNDSE